MSNHLSQLYHELILEHCRHPHNFGILPSPPAIKRIGMNPLCGDNLIVFLDIKNNTICKISFTGSGCAIFLASASLLSIALKEKTCEQALLTIQKFSEITTDTKKVEISTETEKNELKKLYVFSHVKEYPARVKCAMLFARTVESLLKNPETCDSIITSDT